MRDGVGMVDLVAFAIFDVIGPGALDYLQGLVVGQMDVAVGRSVYTPLLSEAGGIVADLTIMRLAHDTFRVVTGGGMGMRDKKWFADHLPADGSVQIQDQTSALYTVGVWGPRARDLLQAATRDDVSNAGFPFGTVKTIEIGGVRALASRISYVGELGWEIYAPMEQGLRLWDTLWEAGQAFGVVACGIGVYATTGRLEKGYRAHGNELELEYDLVEAGMTRPKVKDADFVGKAAYLEQRSKPPAAVLCTLTLDDPTSSTGVARYMLGKEPILSLDGQPLTDAKGRRSYVTSAGSGPSVGQAPADELPAARAGGRRARSCSSNTSASGTRSPSPWPAARRCSTRTTLASGADATVNILACVKRVPATGGRINLTADARDIDTRYLGFVVSPHEECAVEEAVRIVEAQGGIDDRHDPRPGRSRRPAAGRDGDRRGPGGAPRDRRQRLGSGRDRRCPDRGDPRPRGGVRAVRPHPVRQRIRRFGRLPGRDPGRDGPRSADRHRRERPRRGRRARLGPA